MPSKTRSTSTPAPSPAVGPEALSLNLAAPEATFTTHQQNADTASLPGGLRPVATSGQISVDKKFTPVSDLSGGTSACYVPSTTLPGVTDWTLPGLPPSPYTSPALPQQPTFYPTPFPPNFTLNLQSYWGVQQKTEPSKGGPDFWIVDPICLATLNLAKIVARCETREDAQRVADALHFANTPAATAPRKPVVEYWGVQRGTPQGTRSKDPADYRVIDPSKVWKLGYEDSTIVAFCRTENDARHAARLLSEHESAKPACGCNGVTELCSQCPDVVKELSKRLAASRIPLDASPITYNHFKEQVQSLEGRVLTVIDAAIAVEGQNKALKSILKREFRQQISAVYEFCFRGADVAENDQSE